MPSENRKQVVLDAATLENLALIAEHLRADPNTGRSQAIRFAAAHVVDALGLRPKKKTTTKTSPTP